MIKRFIGKVLDKGYLSFDILLEKIENVIVTFLRRG